MNAGEKTYSKDIKQGKESQEKLLQGVNLVADIIKTTLGPKGGNVVVQETPYSKPRSKNDGHYIARSIEHKDPTVNAGAEMMKETCSKTNDRVGDGTTSTSIVGQVILKEGFKEVEKGKNPVDIKKEINEDLKLILEELKNLSTPLKSLEEIENIATISGNNDKEIGKAIRIIKENLDWETPIITERGDENAIKTKYIKGIYFKEGYKKSKAFISNQQKGLCELIGTDEEPVYILCYDGELNDINELNTFLVKVDKYYRNNNRSTADFKILIIAKLAEYSYMPVNMLAKNNLDKLSNRVEKQIINGEEKNVSVGFRCAVIESPRCVGYQPEVLEDIAIATGGKCVGEKTSTRLRDVDPMEVLGTASKIIISRDETSIIGGKGNEQKLANYIELLKKEKEEITKKEDKEALQNRINILSSGIGIIKVGGATNGEAKEREERTEDAILATKAAIEEGTSIGGGNTYYKLAQVAKTNIMKEACLSIPRQIAENTGVKFDGSKIKGNYGFNALNNKYEDLIKAGVIDATKVIRCTLENAVSFASMLLTTHASIIIYEDKQD